MARRFSVEAVFKAVDKVTAPVTRMQNRVGKLTRSMRNSFHKLNRTVNKFGDGMKKGAIAATAALALTTGAMANVISTGAEFEQTIVSAAAKFPGEIRKGTEAFKQLEDAARKTGATTEFTASQSAKALNFLAMAGFNAEQSISALPGVVDLATAAGVDLATATDVATDSLGAFGLMSKDASRLGLNLARVNDVIAKTTTTANTTVESMFETIKDGAPVATAAGASLETFAALTGELANAGIKGSKAGTTLKNMFLTLAAPTAGASKVLDRLGISTKDAQGDMRDIIDILGDLNGSLTGLGTAEKSKVLERIFGKIPIAGVNVLLGVGSKRLREYRGELEKSAGSADKMATVMRDTLQGRLNSLTSAVEGVKISIFSLTSGPLSDTVDKMIEWVRANEGLIASNIGGFLSMVINNFEAIASAMGNIIIGIGSIFALSVALKAVAAVLGIINLIMAANPIVLGILAAVAAVALLSGKLDPLIEIIKTIGGGIADAFGAVSSLGDIFGIGGDKKEGEEDTGILGGLAGALGFGGDEETTGGAVPQVVSPQERVARSIEEKRSTSTAEVTIKDDTGRAEVTSGSLGSGVKLTPSGSF